MKKSHFLFQAKFASTSPPCKISSILVYLEYTFLCMGFPGGSEGKASACNVGDPGSVPGLGRLPGEAHGNPLQYCLENPMGRGAWGATFHEVA